MGYYILVLLSEAHIITVRMGTKKKVQELTELDE
jgi:hypothetical protein